MAGRSAPPPPTNLSRRAYAQAGRFHSFGGFVILLIALLLVVPMGTMLFGYTRYRSWSVANALPTGEGAPAGLGSQPSSTDTPTPLLPDTGKFTLTPTRPEVHFTPVSPAPSATPTPTPGSCGPPEGWVPYIVQRRDTLATIAKASGISAQQLMFANCLNGISWLTPGEVILVPRLPPALVAVTRTAAGSVTPSSSLTATASITPAATTTSTSTALSPGPIQLGQGRQTGTPPAGSPAEEPAAPAPSSASPTPTPTPTEPALPDLVVTEWEFGSQLAVNARGELIMPARVVVTNQGQGIAGDFKVAIQYDDRTSGASRQERFLAFEATSRTDPFYPHSIVPLAPNSSLAFEGNIRIGPELFGKTIYLWSVADSCAEEESSAEHCHVQESDEDNNGSQPILVLLPVSAGGTLQATVTSESAGATPVALPSIFRIRP